MATIYSLPSKIFVSDVARSAAFYRDVLGLTQVVSLEEYGLARFRLSDFLLDLRPFPPASGEQRNDDREFAFTLYQEEFDPIVAALAPKGVLVGGGTYQDERGATLIEINDPDSNKLMIYRLPRNWWPA